MGRQATQLLDDFARKQDLDGLKQELTDAFARTAQRSDNAVALFRSASVAAEQRTDAVVAAFLVATAAADERADRARRLDQVRDVWRTAPARDERIDDHLHRMLDKAGITGGRVLEIGARDRPRAHLFEAQRFRYDDVDIEPGRATITADITDCPQIPDDSYDVVLSVDVFEHIHSPWRAAAEISRILAPGGLAYTSTLFSWRYHPCPIDFWRFSPDALVHLFDGLEPLDSGFDLTERRRDIRRKAEQDPARLDALGGWRENVRVFHAGIKPGGQV